MVAGINRIKYYNVFLDLHNAASALEQCLDFYNSPGCKKIYFINAHCFNLAQKKENYLCALEKADMVLNDGVGIELGAKLAGIRLKENMNGTDFTPLLLKQVAALNKGVFLLGSKASVPEKAKAVLENTIPGINIVGFHDGYFSEEDNTKIIEQINRSEAELLLVGMGVPRQELWIDEFAGQLEHIKIAVAIGAALDFISGRIQRAPLWMRKIKLEWLFRFFLEPTRMFHRYFIGNILFFINIIRLKGK